MSVRGLRLLLLLGVVYTTAMLITRLLTIQVVHADRALMLQLVAVPIAQAAALAMAARLFGKERR